MKHVFQLSTEIGIELLARSKASSLASKALSMPGEIVFDFSDVMFVSRSFADELCNISDKLKDRIEFINMGKNVEEMICGVAEIRRKGREKGRTPARFHIFNDVKSLSEFMLECH